MNSSQLDNFQIFRRADSALQSTELKEAARACPLLDGEQDWAKCCTHRFLPLARRISGNDELALDALQESWIRVLRAVHCYRGGSPACAWVGTIVRNCAKDAHKGGRAREVQLGTVGVLQAHGPDPEAAAQQEELRRLLRAMVAALPTVYRETLELRLLEGESTADTADRLDISRSSVTTRLHRGCALLEKRLADAGLGSRP